MLCRHCLALESFVELNLLLRILASWCKMQIFAAVCLFGLLCSLPLVKGGEERVEGGGVCEGQKYQREATAMLSGFSAVVGLLC